MSKTSCVNDSVGEYEIDSSWKGSLSNEYHEYRRKFHELSTAKAQSPYVGRTPINLEIESTYHCNLACPFCPRRVAPGYKDLKHLDRNVWEKLLSDLVDSDTKSLMMDHEGESLLNPNLCTMIEEARAAGIIDVWLHSNANLLTLDMSKNLISAGVTKLNISIDAVSEETYSKVRPGGNLKQVEDNLLEFIKLRNSLGRYDIRVRVSFVYHERNKHEKDLFIEKWKPHVNLVAIQSLLDMSCFDDPKSYFDNNISSETEKNLASFTCENIWTVPVLDTDGNFIACGMPVRGETAKDLIIGNILESSLSELWNSAKLNKLRNSHIKHNLDNDTCRACAVSFANSAYLQSGLE